MPAHLLTAKSRISAECPRYSLIIFPERASQSRTAPSRLQVYTTAELSSHSSCTIPDWGSGRPQWGPPASLRSPHVPPPPHGVAMSPGEPDPRAKHIRCAETAAALWGSPRLREKYKLGTGPWALRKISNRPKAHLPGLGRGGRAVPRVGTYASGSGWRGHK